MKREIAIARRKRALNEDGEQGPCLIITYEALAAPASARTGTMTANSEREVVSMLDAQGLFPLKIEMTKGAARVAQGRPARRLAAHGDLLLAAGRPAPRRRAAVALPGNPRTAKHQRRPCAKSCARSTSRSPTAPRWPTPWRNIRKAFNELSVSMVRAGQEGGFLEDVLERIAHFTEHQEDLKAKVIGALAYPVFLAVTAFVVLMVLVVFFVPMFEPIFEKLEEKGELPVLTIALIGFSNAIIDYWCVIPFVVVGLVFGYWHLTSTDAASCGSTRCG